MTNSKLTFSSVNLFDFNAKKQAKKTCTKAWLNSHLRHLWRFNNLATSSNANYNNIVLSLCLSAYGDNIGKQVNEELTSAQKNKVINFLKFDMN